MFDPTEPQVVPGTQLLLILEELIDTGNLLDVTTLVLFSNDIVPSRSTMAADIVEPTFTGYAAVAAIVWGAPYYDADGSGIVTAASAEFVCTGGTPSDVIYGWALMNAGKTVLKKASRLATPVPIAAVGAGFTCVPWYRYTGQ